MSLYPENPAGQVYQVTSQDTFASAGAPLSVVGSGGGGPVVIPENLVVSTLTAADFVSTVALEGVSTINGAPYATGGGGGPVPANLTVSSLTAADTVTASLLLLNGAEEVAIEVGADAGLGGSSQYIAFNSPSQDTADAGQLAIFKSVTTSVSNPSGAAGLAIYAVSTSLGSYQRLACSDIYIVESAANNDDGRLAFALEAVNNPVSSLNIQAPNVHFSSLIGISSINGVNWAVLSTLAAGA